MVYNSGDFCNSISGPEEAILEWSGRNVLLKEPVM